MTVNQKMALVAQAVLIWKTLNAELARLSQVPLGKEAHEQFAARWGTRTVGRKRPYGAGADNEVSIDTRGSPPHAMLTCADSEQHWHDISVPAG